MDALSTEDSITKSAKLISKRKRKTARKRANKKERQQNLDQMLKNLEAPKNEESSIEDVANLENSDAQMLPLGHLKIQRESTTTLLEKSPVKKKKRSVMKALNKKVDPCSMDQNSVPSNPSVLDSKHGEVENGLLNPNITIEDVASLANSDAQLLPRGHLGIQTELTTTLLEKSPGKKKRLKKRMKALKKKVDPGSTGLNNVPSNPSLLDNKHGDVENGLLNPNISIKDVASLDNSDAQLLPLGHLEIQTELTTTLLEKSPGKKKRLKKRMKALKKKVDPCSTGLNNVPSNPIMLDNKHEEVENFLLNPNIFIEDVANLENSDAQLLPRGHLEIQTEVTTTLLEKSPGKKKRLKKQMKALKKKVDPCSTGLNNVPSNPSLLDNKYGEVENGLLNPNISIKDVASLHNSNAQLLPLGHLEIQTEGATTLLEKSSVKGKKKRKRKKKTSVMKALSKEVDPCSMDQTNVPSNNKHGEVENGLLNPNISFEDVTSLENSDAQLLPLGPKGDDVKVANGAMEGEVSLFEAGRISPESCSERTRLTHNSELIMHVHATPTRPGDFCMMKGPCLRRKLLILDVNGLLADVVNPPPKDCNPDACFWRRAIFKRPYCNDFLKFCFERFDVGIWSSRSKKIVVKVVDYLLGNLKHKLLFCWDMSHSTQTMFKTLENKHKPLVCKELSKVWDRYDPNLPWERGDYDESNTLLLDDSPYKALLNPAHTAIFPHSYTFKAENDNSLGPGGDLRIYLEELLKAEHVQKYVEQHPFGQRAIDQTSSDWNFYFDVLSSLRGQSG
ncbi:uncharacterized protein LOC132621520 [Lycium barbarum]|uniref:uncharacterized protein LOC132621520 n=1 Tax=Lycium barbarum TaxID=112863 RepID=UPI00293E61D5|nr:uncharacterized protein LOC132621520 [Lycium barbarum]XP_060191802.1 uncharacterized protein LOC132621520 [Lycium barbarum]XP_060191804.1 uncharacterized protein LOC132621520 [Lycium barbarum]XP_060191805.1 uncharacterized protein LOC132621520 [Lycium barbarum]XP_060191806.1 uncharacterized protein LOC132621520 [Lycium barbarum]